MWSIVMLNCITQMMVRDMSIRVIKPPQTHGYADLIAFALISTNEVLDEEPRDYKEVVRI